MAAFLTYSIAFLLFAVKPLTASAASVAYSRLIFENITRGGKMSVHTGVTELLRRRQLAASPDQDPFVMTPPPSVIESLGADAISAEAAAEHHPPKDRFATFFQRIAGAALGPRPELSE